jgi:plastocyanin
MLTRRISLTLVMLTVALTAYGCGSGGGDVMAPPAGSGNTVAATPDLAFQPQTITVHAGDAVTFAFGSVAHNVFFDAQAGAPGNIEGTNAGVSIQRTFATAGTFPYTCHIHPSMHGTVVVQ